jgi:hypothetical protein
MLRGHSPQSIIRVLRTTETVVYNDIKFLTEKSREYVFDMAKGTHALIYQRSIEGINETLAECWSIYNNNKNKNISLFQKVAVLKLVKAIFRLTSEEPAVLAIQDIAKRAERLGIDTDNNTPSFPPSEEQQIHNYMSKNSDATFDAGITDTDTDINRNNNYNTNEAELS